MSILPSADIDWVPSKEFMAAIRGCYNNGQSIDLTRFNAQDWIQAVAFSENAENLRQLIVETADVSEFIDDLNEAGVNIDLESLCSFGNLSFVIDSKIHDTKELNSAITFIIENKIPMNQMGWPHLKSGLVDIEFKYILDPFSLKWFENWRSGDSIYAGALLVSLCDYLGVKIEPLAKSPHEWDIEEIEFAEYAKENKESLKKFARLFSKPMNQWYSEEWCS